jgi:aryl-alcohol dehydrogenase-like predicted oxidoreductase
MTYTVLGPSDLNVSAIAFGCMSLGDDVAANVRLLHAALDGGITLFDTADLYQHGRNEECVGRAFHDRRDRVVIATKGGNQWRPDGSGWDWNPTRAYILEAVESSLRRLQTDYIDLYQLHGGTLDDPIDETIGAFELLKQQGKIRAYGISSIRPSVIQEWVPRSHLASVMMQYSLLDRRPEEACLQFLHKNRVSVLARGSLARGLLAGKPAAEFLTHSKTDVQRAAEAVAAQSDETRPPAATAIRYALHHPAVASAVVGIRTTEQLHEALRAGDAPDLTPEEWTVLSQALPSNRYDQHR